MFNYRAYLIMTSRSMYHIVMFLSFVGSFKILPYVQEQIVKYIKQDYLQLPAAYLVTYIIAIYILPEIASYIYLKSKEEQVQ